MALDEMVPELGPLEYVSGSHLWGDGRSGTASHFFDLLVVRVYGCLTLALTLTPTLTLTDNPQPQPQP